MKLLAESTSLSFFPLVKIFKGLFIMICPTMIAPFTLSGISDIYRRYQWNFSHYGVFALQIFANIGQIRHFMIKT